MCRTDENSKMRKPQNTFCWFRRRIRRKEFAVSKRTRTFNKIIKRANFFFALASCYDAIFLIIQDFLLYILRDLEVSDWNWRNRETLIFMRKKYF